MTLWSRGDVFARLAFELGKHVSDQNLVECLKNALDEACISLKQHEEIMRDVLDIVAQHSNDAEMLNKIGKALTRFSE